MESWEAVLHSAKEMRVEACAAPVLRNDDDVLVEMKRVGICGSDVHYWQHGRCGDFVLHQPMVIGHESSGVVAAVGANVTHVRPGDRVALEPGVPCRTCELCRTGAYNLCPDMAFFATPPVHGSLAKYVVHPADYCFKLPEAVSLDEGAMCEPLSVGVYACERAGVVPGARVLILGAGPIGLVCYLVAKAFGAVEAVITDISEERLAFARSLGVEHTLLAKDVAPRDMAQQVQAALGGHRPDVSFECCGFQDPTCTAIFATKSNGCVCLIGMNQPVMNLPLFEASARQVDLKGIFRYRNTYPTCIALLAARKLDVSALITHRYPVDQLLEGFETSRVGRDGAIKVMFEL